MRVFGSMLQERCEGKNSSLPVPQLSLLQPWFAMAGWRLAVGGSRLVGWRVEGGGLEAGDSGVGGWEMLGSDGVDIGDFFFVFCSTFLFLGGVYRGRDPPSGCEILCRVSTRGMRTIAIV